MQISSITVCGYGSGVLIVDTEDGNHTNIKLTDEQNERVLILARDIFNENRATLIEELKKSFPALVYYSESND